MDEPRHFKAFRPRDSKRLVGGRDDDAAAVEMGGDQSGKKPVGADVERRRRLVEKPDGPEGDNELRHGHAPTEE